MRFELPVLSAPSWRESSALGRGKVRRVAWLADGTLLSAPYASGLDAWKDGVPERARVLARDGSVRADIPLDGGPVLDVAVDAAVTRLATAHLDGAVGLWSLPDGAPLATLRGHTARTVSLAFTRGGDTLVSGSWDGTARVWPLGPLDADPGALRDAVISDWAVGLDDIIGRSAAP